MSISKILILAVCVLASACTHGVDRRYVGPKGVIHTSYLFDHVKHKPVMKEMGLNCVSCHPQTKSLESLAKASAPGRKFECHDCHRNPSMLSEVPQRCDLCHADIQSVLPTDHRLDWQNRHAIFARVDPAKCATCHDQSSCTDCHLQRDSIQTTVHPRTFLYSHSIEARANPNSCGSCHQVSTCRDCHVGKGVSF